MSCAGNALAFIALLAATPVVAADLYKCIDAKGLVSIQSKPCATGSTQVWKRDANPQPDQMPVVTPQGDRNDEAGRGANQPARPPVQILPEQAAAPNDAPNLKGPCRRAHELADEIGKLELLELRSDQVYRLNAWVAKQCEAARSGQ